MAQGISPNNLNKISEVYLSQISEHHKKDADGNTIPHEGEEVEEGDVVLLISTTKTALEIEATISGKISQINFSEGDLVQVGDVVGQIE